MPKTIILGDTHGRTLWKSILEKEKDYDKAIFIGDYLDTHENITGLEQLNNFEAICKFKRESDKEVIMLIGNHDFHYWPSMEDRYSGYQPDMKVAFEGALYFNRELLQMCHVDQYGNIYSHAGFTETFVGQRIGSFSERAVNAIWKHKPNTFHFYYQDWSGCGDDPHQSCIWVRPQSLYRDMIDGIQVVGHTSVKNIKPPESGKNGFWLVDCLANGQYLINIDGKFEIGQI